MRIGFDLDGTLADLASAYREIDFRLFGPDSLSDEVPEAPEEAEPDEGSGTSGREVPLSTVGREIRSLREEQRRRAEVWRTIESTENFWTTLRPIEPGCVRRLAEVAHRRRWEVFFVTQRPETTGETAQRQSQRWLVAEGFELPTVIVSRGSRGRLAAALNLDYLVDDSPRNCIDIVSDSKTRVIMVSRAADPLADDSARRLGAKVVRSVVDALDMLEAIQGVSGSGGFFSRLARKTGLR